MIIFEGMWKGVLLGFSVLTFVFVMYFKVFSQIMPGDNDPGDEITPAEM